MSSPLQLTLENTVLEGQSIVVAPGTLNVEILPRRLWPKDLSGYYKTRDIDYTKLSVFDISGMLPFTLTALEGQGHAPSIPMRDDCYKVVRVPTFRTPVSVAVFSYDAGERETQQGAIAALDDKMINVWDMPSLEYEGSARRISMELEPSRSYDIITFGSSRLGQAVMSIQNLSPAPARAGLTLDELQYIALKSSGLSRDEARGYDAILRVLEAPEGRAVLGISKTGYLVCFGKNKLAEEGMGFGLGAATVLPNGVASFDVDPGDFHRRLGNWLVANDWDPY